jgi:preprotein translocase subunit YajC
LTSPPALARCGASPYDDEHGTWHQARRGWSVGPFLFVSCDVAGQYRTKPIVITYLYQSLLLAQDNAVAAPEAPGESGAFMRLMLMLLAMMVLFYFIMFRPQKRKEEEARRMVQNLKDNDHVVTIGGIYGVVTNVQREAQRVTVRVDEATGTKLRISMSAIARVITDDDQEGTGSAGSKS